MMYTIDSEEYKAVLIFKKFKSVWYKPEIE